MRLFRRLLLRPAPLVAVVVFALLVFPVGGQSPEQIPAAWSEALATLAEKIVADAMPANTLYLSSQDMSSLDQVTTNRIFTELVGQVSRRGSWQAQQQGTTPEPSYLLSKNSSQRLPADVNVQIAFSEGADGYVWIAQINRGDSPHIEMVSLSKQGAAGIRSGKPWLTLRRNVLWAQSEPLLDFSEEQSTEGPTRMITVLEPDRVGRGMLAGDFLTISSTSPLLKIPVARDLRGRLESAPDGQITAYIAGSVCTGEPANASFNCVREQAKDWLMGDGLEAVYVANRNYFAGLLSAPADPTAEGRPFYSAAILSSGSKRPFILAELEGTSHLYDVSDAQPATFRGWGDDIVFMATNCDSSEHVLVTGVGDWTQPDRLQLYEISGGTATAVGQPVEFPGPVLALWSSDDTKSARIVSRNLHTGLYEASTVSVSCSD